MFEQSILANASRAKRVWTASLGVSGQVLLVASMVVAPMLWPEALPHAAFTMLVPSAPWGRSTHDKSAGQQNHPARPVRRARFDPHHFVQPTSAPAEPVQIIESIDAPAADHIGVVGAPLEGPGGDRGNGLLDGILRETVVERPPAPTSHPVEQRRVEPAVIPLVKSGGIVKDPVLVHRVEPRYPDIARRAGISGVVKLTGIIGIDGRIRGLTVESGNPLLITAATDAVRQWVYRPTLLNGDPVEVITEIVVTFTLNR